MPRVACVNKKGDAYQPHTFVHGWAEYSFEGAPDGKKRCGRIRGRNVKHADQKIQQQVQLDSIVISWYHHASASSAATKKRPACRTISLIDNDGTISPNPQLNLLIENQHICKAQVWKDKWRNFRRSTV
jgi:hypothetical protein